LLAGKPYGVVLLWLLGAGFAAYALWRLSEAAFGVTGDPPGAGPRLKSLGRAVLYAGFAYLTFDVISGSRRSQSHQQQDVTATAMRHAEGRWLVGIIGLAVVIAGLVLVSEGVRRKFMKYLRTQQMSRRTRRVVEVLGMIGTIARGWCSRWPGRSSSTPPSPTRRRRPAASTKPCSRCENQPFGEVLLLAAALGLVVFGIYGLCEARWRKV